MLLIQKEKEKIIGEEFIRVFEEEAKKKIGTVDFLVQGTIYPDVIESGLGKVLLLKVTIMSEVFLTMLILKKL